MTDKDQKMSSENKSISNSKFERSVKIEDYNNTNKKSISPSSSMSRKFSRSRSRSNSKRMDVDYNPKNKRSRSRSRRSRSKSRDSNNKPNENKEDPNRKPPALNFMIFLTKSLESEIAKYQIVKKVNYKLKLFYR